MTPNQNGEPSMIARAEMLQPKIEKIQSTGLLDRQAAFGQFNSFCTVGQFQPIGSKLAALCDAGLEEPTTPARIRR